MKWNENIQHDEKNEIWWHNKEKISENFEKLFERIFEKIFERDFFIKSVMFQIFDNQMWSSSHDYIKKFFFSIF